MSNVLKKEKLNKMVQESYKIFRKKEKNGWTKSATVNELVKMIEKELEEDVN